MTEQEQAVHTALRHYQAGHPAPATLVAYGEMVVNVITRKFFFRAEAKPDVLQQGWMGLLVAAGRFDFRPGNTFATYASLYVWQAILEYVIRHKRGRPFAIKEHQHARMQTLRRAWQALLVTHKRPPTREEWFASVRGKSVRRGQFTRDQFNEMSFLLAVQSTPIDTSFVNNDDEVVPRDVADPHEYGFEARDAARCVAQALEQLPAADRAVLHMRFGFLPRGEWTLVEIGSAFGVTKQAIDQRIPHVLGRLAARLKAASPDLVAEYEQG